MSYALIPNDHAYIILSAGPDRDFDYLFDSETTTDTATFSSYLLTITYDPSNGIISDGDIIRTRLGIPGRPGD